MGLELVTFEGQLYAWLTVGSAVAAVLWESAAPCRIAKYSLIRRWINHFGMLLLNSGVTALAMPILAGAFALRLSEGGVGLLNQVSMSTWVSLPLSFLLLDLGRYCVHRFYHRAPVLWRLHAVHHSDPEFDWTTSFRVHPIEVMLNIAPQLGLILLIGPPAAAVVIYEATRAFLSIWGHANIRLPESFNRIALLLVVTPPMHRIHHSARRPETDSNYGDVLPWWDKLFSTYTIQPYLGHEEMQVGLSAYRHLRFLSIRWILAQPFMKPSSRT